MGGVDTCLHLSLLSIRLSCYYCLSSLLERFSSSRLCSRELDFFCGTFNILAELRPELPRREDTNKDASAGKRAAKNWNYHFFWIDVSICLISVPWHAGASVLKGPLPSNNHVNAELLALLDHHRIIIRRYPETFLCLVGLSHSFDDVHVRPTLLKDDGSDMGLLDFVKSADPFNVKTGERTLVEEEEHAGKKKRRVVFEDLLAKRLRADADVVSGRVPTTGVLGLMMRLPLLGLMTLLRLLLEVQIVKTATADNIHVPEWDITNGAQVDNPALCRNLLDHVTPPSYWVALRNQSNACFLDAFNINSAQHTCMLSELCLRYEHKVVTKEKFQKKFTDNYVVVQQRDAEIAALRSRLEEVEREAAKFVALRSYVSELEVGMAVKFEEVNTLSKHNVELLSKASTFESEHGQLNRHIIKLWVDYERLRSEMSTKIDARIADVRRDMDNNLSALDELESLKDSPFKSIMSALVLKDAQGNVDSTPELQQFQPSHDQVTVPIYSEFGSVNGEMLLSKVVPIARTAAVSTFVLSDDERSANQPPVAHPHDDMFDTSVLDGSGDD
ncbi:hypothetical protein Tco_1045529 [Tanacetum coccineum]|uniref:Transposase (Putative), gypsy type n=1 Tax=Tanacetum coccineum TaxID=301880 RepID=A0ABQ5GTM1_9ASTR